MTTLTTNDNPSNENEKKEEKGPIEKNLAWIIGGVLLLALLFCFFSNFSGKKDVDENNDLFASAGQDLNSAYRKQKQAEKSAAKYYRATEKFCANQTGDNLISNNSTTQNTTTSESTLTDDQIVEKAVEIAKKEKTIQDAKDLLAGKEKCEEVKKTVKPRVITRTRIIRESSAPCPTGTTYSSSSTSGVSSSTTTSSTNTSGAPVIFKLWNPTHTKSMDFPRTKRGKQQLIEFAKEHKLDIGELPADNLLPD